jgi:uncharacterized protein YggE
MKKTFALFALILMMGGVRSMASSDDQDQNILTVSGVGEVKVASNVAIVSLAVETTAKTTEGAQTEAARKTSAVVAFLKAEKVKKLQTTQATLNPEYKYDQGKSILVGHRAVQALSFETPTDQAGRIMDQAVAKGATRVDSVTFQADEANRQKAEDEALIRAADKARAKAKTVLNALGLTWEKIAFIRVNPHDPIQPMPRPFAMRAMAADAAPASAPSPTLGGEDTVRVSITMGVMYR